MIKTVIFDIDNTVYDYDYCNGIAMNALSIYACQRYKISQKKFESAFYSSRKEIKELLGETASSHNRMLYMQLFLEKLGYFPCEGALELYDIYWDTMLDTMQLFPYVIPLLKELRFSGIKIGFLTDLTAHIQHRKIKRLGLEKYADSIVSSEESGCEKPSTKMFERILKKTECLPYEALMIGDDQKRDIDGANNIGMNSLLFIKSETDVFNEKVFKLINAQNN